MFIFNGIKKQPKDAYSTSCSTVTYLYDIPQRLQANKIHIYLVIHFKCFEDEKTVITRDSERNDYW